MPRGDGTGPPWGGGSGIGRGMRQIGKGGMRGTQPGSGPGGDCICHNCGTRMPHQAGVPCYNLSCSKCGSKMVKEA